MVFDSAVVDEMLDRYLEEQATIQEPKLLQ